MAAAAAMREHGDDEAAAEDAERGAGERTAGDEEEGRGEHEVNAEGERGATAVAVGPKVAFTIRTEMGLTPAILKPRRHWEVTACPPQ